MTVLQPQAISRFSYKFAISRRDAAESCLEFFALQEERTQGMPDARSTRGLASNVTRCACVRGDAVGVLHFSLKELRRPELQWNGIVRRTATYIKFSGGQSLRGSHVKADPRETQVHFAHRGVFVPDDDFVDRPGE